MRGDWRMRSGGIGVVEDAVYARILDGSI